MSSPSLGRKYPHFHALLCFFTCLSCKQRDIVSAGTSTLHPLGRENRLAFPLLRAVFSLFLRKIKMEAVCKEDSTGNIMQMG